MSDLEKQVKEALHEIQKVIASCRCREEAHAWVAWVLGQVGTLG